MNGELVRGAAPPAPKSLLEIKRIKSSEPTTYACLSKSIFGQFVHFHGGRSNECFADKKKVCDGCTRGHPIKWLGYLHVQQAGMDSTCFIEITNIAWHLLEAQAPKGISLRGMMFRIRKTKGGAKGRFIIEVLERRLDEVMLPDEKDPYPVLKFLWSCKRPAMTGHD